MPVFCLPLIWLYFLRLGNVGSAYYKENFWIDMSYLVGALCCSTGINRILVCVARAFGPFLTDLERKHSMCQAFFYYTINNISDVL